MKRSEIARERMKRTIEHQLAQSECARLEAEWTRIVVLFTFALLALALLGV